MSFGDQADQATTTDSTTEAELTSTTAKSTDQVQLLEDGRMVVNGKMFTPEAAAKKIANADPHIDTLEAEAAKKDEALIKLTDKLAALEARLKHTDDLEELASKLTPAQVTPEPTPLPEFSKEELIEATKDALLADQVQATQEANLNAMVEAAKESYGAEDFGTQIDLIGAKLGMDTDAVLNMARNQPNAWKTLFLPAGDTERKPDTGSTLSGDEGQDSTIPAAKHKPFLRMSVKERTNVVAARMAALESKG